MRKTNLLIFNELPSDKYFKTVGEAARFFKDISRFPDSLGFDAESEGFLVLHRKHSPSAFAQEIPVCVFLKKRGYRVVLEDEPPEIRAADCRIDDLIFEIKQISNAKRIHKSIVRHVQEAQFKAKRVLIHICQPANDSQIEGGIEDALRHYKKVEVIWVVRNWELFEFDKSQKKLRRITSQ